MSIDLDEFETPEQPDFRRANGAPMVLMPDGKRKRMSRPSNFAKPLDDESALTNWRIDRAIAGVAHDASLVARAIAIEPDSRDAWKRLREDAIQRGRGSEAADIGTAVHAMSVRWEQDPTFSPPRPYLDCLEAYTAAMDEYGLHSLCFEQPMVNVAVNAAGTFDRLYGLSRALVAPDGQVLPPGTCLIGDLKSNKTLEYSKAAYAVQMSVYAGGEFYDVINECFIDTPTINQDWGIIVWLPASDPGHCELLWADLRLGRYGAEMATLVKDWRKEWRNGTNDFHPMNPIVVYAEPAPVEVSPEMELTYVEAQVVWIQARLSAIKNHDSATVALMNRWPENVPTPKQGLSTPEHVDRVIALLDEIERDFMLPFVGGQPANPDADRRRVTTTTGGN